MHLLTADMQLLTSGGAAATSLRQSATPTSCECHLWLRTVAQSCCSSLSKGAFIIAPFRLQSYNLDPSDAELCR